MTPVALTRIWSPRLTISPELVQSFLAATSTVMVFTGTSGFRVMRSPSAVSETGIVVAGEELVTAGFSG